MLFGLLITNMLSIIRKLAQLFNQHCFNWRSKHRNNTCIQIFRMKKIIFSTLIFVFLLAVGIMAQTPPHPNGGGEPGPGNTPVGGGASIGGGLLIMVSLGVGYGLRKIYDIRNKSQEELKID